MLAEVSMDHVGLALGLEISRLSRTCKDWHQLLELCGLFGALLADQDGVYDPSDPNDRLVLGLKGQISELELHSIRSRLFRGKLNKARRGERIINVPIGYVKTPAGGLALDPDEQARAVVRLLVDKFEEMGTAHAVTRYLRLNHIRLGIRPHDGPNRANLEWRPALVGTVYRILTDPAAGRYAYGHTPIEPTRRRRNGQPDIRRAPMAEWAVTLHDRLPAYITSRQYLRNTERIRQNRTTASTPGFPPAVESRGPIHAGACHGPGLPTGPKPEATGLRGSGGRGMVAPRPGGRARRRIRPIKERVRRGYGHARRVGSRKHLVIWADANERERLRDALRPGQTSPYPAELNRPKARPDQGT
jgi:DNA invertase Pin-like site-specific DNA recombinase